MLDGKYIVIEGAIGVGKTSLAKELSREINGKLVLEKSEENPFLEEFYSNREEYAFQTQMFFLLSRYRQQQKILQRELFKRAVVCDYLFAKDTIFAYLNLNEEELGLYNHLEPLLAKRIPAPDLVIYLQASTSVLIQRIKNRGKQYEMEISQSYTEELNKAYNQFFFLYKDSPLLFVDTDQIDFVHSKIDLKDLIKTIKDMRGGTQYYKPVSSDVFGLTERTI